MLFFSIITISYNEKRNIAKTINSVLKQSFRDFEYIIIDGASNDGTVDIERKMLSLVKDVNTCLVSEPDSGIYNAMNKGIDIAKGEWLIFLNAGDSFVDCNVLKNIFNCISNNKKKCNIYYGDSICQYHDLFKRIKALLPNVLKNKMPFCHQCAIINNKIMKKYKYCEKYKIAADYNFFLSAYLQGEKFKYIGIVVAIFNLEGISSSGNVRQPLECLDIQHTHGIIDNITYKKNIKIIKIKRKIINCGKRIFPKKLVEIIRRKKLCKNGFQKNIYF